MPRSEPDDDDEIISEDAPRAFRPHDPTVIVFRGSANRPVVVPAEVAEDAEKIYRCHIKKLSGMSWRQIADEEGFPDQLSCRLQVERYLAEGRAMVEQYTAKQMLINEVMLLDYMQSRLWTAVEAGDRQSIETVMKLADKRVAWQNLAISDDSKATEVHTVVIRGESYTEYLRNASEKAQIDAGTPDQDRQTVISTAAEATDQEER